MIDEAAIVEAVKGVCERGQTSLLQGIAERLNDVCAFNARHQQILDDFPMTTAEAAQFLAVENSTLRKYSSDSGAAEIGIEPIPCFQAGKGRQKTYIRSELIRWRERNLRVQRDVPKPEDAKKELDPKNDWLSRHGLEYRGSEKRLAVVGEGSGLARTGSGA